LSAQTDIYSYAATFLGWLLAAVTNTHMARCLGLGTILTIGGGIQLLAHLLRFWTPPFGLYLATFFIQAVGMAYNDTHANTYVASVKGAHRWLGFVHAMYALGCLISPFVATSIAARINHPWPLFYLFLVGIGAINLVGLVILFRDDMKIDPATSPPELVERERTNRGNNANRDIIDTLKSPSVYLLALFYFFMLGAAITAGGWVVEYLISARNGRLPDVGYVASGLWGGMFLGRVLLAKPTHRFGERRMAMAYCCIILVLQLIFWLVPNLVGSAIAICFMGFFQGPLFATVSLIVFQPFCQDTKSSTGYVYRLKVVREADSADRNWFCFRACPSWRRTFPSPDRCHCKPRRCESHATYNGGIDCCNGHSVGPCPQGAEAR
jgi:fucose permease